MKKIIERFNPEMGNHSISNSIRQVLNYHGYFISEEMVFGLASGLCFSYYEFKNVPVPAICGRKKIGEFEDKLAENLGIKIEAHETASKKKAQTEMLKMIDNNEPVVVYTDMGLLPYLHMPEDFHDGRYTVVVFGIDEEEGSVYISDRDEKGYKITMNEEEEPDDYHVISIEELAAARNSKEKPFAPKNRWLTFGTTEMPEIDKKVIYKAILNNSSFMLNPPAGNLGLNGIQMLKDKLAEWQDFDDDTLGEAAYQSYLAINEIGGTGGGCFRRLYGNFMRESAEITQIDFLKKAGVQYVKLADEWDEIGKMMLNIYETGDREILGKVANKLLIIHIREKELALRINEFINNDK